MSVIWTLEMLPLKTSSCLFVPTWALCPFLNESLARMRITYRLIKLGLIASDVVSRMEGMGACRKKCRFLRKRRKMLCGKSTMSLKATMFFVRVNLLFGSLSQLNLNSHVAVGKLTCFNRHPCEVETQKLFSFHP